MDAKDREQVIYLTIWAALIAVRAWFLFRRPEYRTSDRIWLFAGTAVLGAMVLLVVAPVVAGARTP
ncbi:hypothetical protein EON77_01505 [bacterium]|nr:MAG: hypothetical protein EON77_01505 [bacterium]